MKTVELTENKATINPLFSNKIVKISEDGLSGVEITEKTLRIYTPTLNKHNEEILRKIIGRKGY